MKEPEPRRKKDKRSKEKRPTAQSDPIELFKLHLSVLKEEDKPALPDGMTYRMVITDYLRELRKVRRAIFNDIFINKRFHQG